MGSLDSDERFISKSLPISQLVEHIRYSFRERDFVEVQNALIERENNLKMEIESLVIERDSAKNEVCLVERSMKLIKRFKFEDKLEKSHNKWKKLEESVVRLVEENREFKNLEKRAEEERDRIFADNMKLVIEKNELVCELNKMVNERESKSLENEENCKSLDTMEAKMGLEIQELEKEKSGALKSVKVYESNRTIAELTGKLNELKRKNLESEAKMAQEIDELKKEKSGASNTIVELKGKVCELNMTIAELTRRLNELKRIYLESEQLARAGDEKCKSLDTLAAKMGQEIDELKKEKSGASNTIVELKGKVCESNRTIAKLTRRLKRKNSESEQLARAGDEKCKSLDTLVAKMGQEIDELKKEKSGASNTIVELKGKVCESNRMIAKLTRRLKRKNSESEQLARAGDEKCKSLDTLVAKMGQEIDELKKEKSGASNTIVELKGKVCESNRMIAKLTRRLKKKNSESEQLARAGDEKCKSLDTLVAKMGQEIEELKKEKSGASKIIVELNGAIVEASRIVNDLKVKKSKSDEVVELYRRQIKDLCMKIQKTNEAVEGGNLNFQQSRGKTGRSGNGDTLHGAGDGSRSCGLLKKGCRSLVKCSTGENDASVVKTPGLPSGQNSLRMETSEGDKPLDLEGLFKLKGPHSSSGSKGKKTASPPQGRSESQQKDPKCSRPKEPVTWVGKKRRHSKQESLPKKQARTHRTEVVTPEEDVGGSGPSIQDLEAANKDLVAQVKRLNELKVELASELSKRDRCHQNEMRAKEDELAEAKARQTEIKEKLDKAMPLVLLKPDSDQAVTRGRLEGRQFFFRSKVCEAFLESYRRQQEDFCRSPRFLEKLVPAFMQTAIDEVHAQGFTGEALIKKLPNCPTGFEGDPTLPLGHVWWNETFGKCLLRRGLMDKIVPPVTPIVVQPITPEGTQVVVDGADSSINPAEASSSHPAGGEASRANPSDNDANVTLPS